MSGEAVAGGFLVLVGCWLGLTAMRADDRRWSRLTLVWPVPWSQLGERARLATRGVCCSVAFALVAAGVWLAARPA